ncbi:transcription initiation factor TFIID subunit 11-like [Arachis ipaensis]|uniref:transcription initiation factor TFIID subunit 11-like n=1 Tax=Arachis ipaensis TaxID=130454 RepID=UPI0007AF0A6B|nr:transcription initiation factor TFIID subunit 11-like [Arachis ipaensis]XP_025651995.1 transcription initiation factor TFIID subunit 11-like [Arachis hypogaea]
MTKKTILQKPPREKVLKLPTKSKPSTRSQDQTFTPSPSLPTSPPCTDPMVRIKNPSRSPPPFKLTAPSSAPSKPSTSKGKRSTAEEPASEPTGPKLRSALSRPQRGRDIILNNETISDSLKYTNVGTCAYKSDKWDEGKKGSTRSERVVFDDDDDDDDDDDYESEDTPSPSTTGTSASIGHKSALYEVVKDVVQEFVSQLNHLIAISKEQRKLATKHVNFLRKSRDRVVIFLKFIDNLQEDDNAATDSEEDADSDEDGSDA